MALVEVETEAKLITKCRIWRKVIEAGTADETIVHNLKPRHNLKH
jgi:hypothetical protein